MTTTETTYQLYNQITYIIMKVIRSNKELHYAMQMEKVAIIQANPRALAKEAQSERYRLDIDWFKVLTDATGLDTLEPLQSLEPIYFSYLEVDNARFAFKNGIQITSVEADEVTAQLALKAIKDLKPFFSEPNDWYLTE